MQWRASNSRLACGAQHSLRAGNGQRIEELRRIDVLIEEFRPEIVIEGERTIRGPGECRVYPQRLQKANRAHFVGEKRDSAEAALGGIARDSVAIRWIVIGTGRSPTGHVCGSRGMPPGCIGNREGNGE